MIKLVAENGWQDISTAPKDGTWIVGYRGDTGTEPIYVVMRWWDGFMDDDFDDLSTDEVGEWVGHDESPRHFEEVSHWLAFNPHPHAPAPTVCMDSFFGEGSYPSRAERGISEETIKNTQAWYRAYQEHYDRTGEFPDPSEIDSLLGFREAAT